jgi:hypothetical protein
VGVIPQRNEKEDKRLAEDKMRLAKRKFENITSLDKIGPANSEAGNRRIAHMFLKSVPPLRMFKKDLAPVSHMSQAPRNQRKMRKVVHNPLQMGPPIVIQFSPVMLKADCDLDDD